MVASVNGGGLSGQAGALRHGIARALVCSDADMKSKLKKRDSLPETQEKLKGRNTDRPALGEGSNSRNGNGLALFLGDIMARSLSGLFI